MSRRELKLEVNTLLHQKLGPYPVFFTRDQVVKFMNTDADEPVATRGAYAVYWGKESQARDSYALCPQPRTIPLIVDCYGRDEETADTMYEALKDMLSATENTLQHGVPLRIEAEALYADDTQTDAVRAVAILQYIS